MGIFAIWSSQLGIKRIVQIIVIRPNKTERLRLLILNSDLLFLEQHFRNLIGQCLTVQRTHFAFHAVVMKKVINRHCLMKTDNVRLSLRSEYFSASTVQSANKWSIQ